MPVVTFGSWRNIRPSDSVRDSAPAVSASLLTQCWRLWWEEEMKIVYMGVKKRKISWRMESRKEMNDESPKKQ